MDAYPPRAALYNAVVPSLPLTLTLIWPATALAASRLPLSTALKKALVLSSSDNTGAGAVAFCKAMSLDAARGNESLLLAECESEL